MPSVVCARRIHLGATIHLRVHCLTGGSPLPVLGQEEEEEREEEEEEDDDDDDDDDEEEE